MEIGDGRVLARAIFDLAPNSCREILVRCRYLGFLETSDGLEKSALSHPCRTADADAERVARETRANLGTVLENAAKGFRD